MKVAVVGTGRVGLPLALSLVDAGCGVFGVDTDAELRYQVNVVKRMPFIEPGYDEVISSGRFSIDADYDRIADADYIIVTVGTPLRQHIETDLSAVEQVLQALSTRVRQGQTIILRSTVAPGTTCYARKVLERASGLRIGASLFLAFCPERIVEGRAREELQTLPQIVGSDDEASGEKARKLFQKLGVETLMCDVRTAELAKLFSNVSRYLYFSVSNYLAMVATELGAEFYEIAQLMNYHYPRPLQSLPGFTAGTCLRKDFGMLSETHTGSDILVDAWRVNESLPYFLVHSGVQRWGELTGRTVAVLGCAFKKDSDDIRDSLTPKLVRYLMREVPEEVRLTDPFVPTETASRIAGCTFTESYEDAIADADLVIIATNHSLYNANRHKILEQCAMRKANIIDVWNVLGTHRIFISGVGGDA